MVILRLTARGGPAVAARSRSCPRWAHRRSRVGAHPSGSRDWRAGIGRWRVTSAIVLTAEPALSLDGIGLGHTASSSACSPFAWPAPTLRLVGSQPGDRHHPPIASIVSSAGRGVRRSAASSTEPSQSCLRPCRPPGNRQRLAAVGVEVSANACVGCAAASAVLPPESAKSTARAN